MTSTEPCRMHADQAGMLLLHTAAHPTIEQHRHPNLGRLLVPQCWSRVHDTLASGVPCAIDSGAFGGLDVEGVCRMLSGVMAWPTVGARIRKAWAWAATGDIWTSGARGGLRRTVVLDETPLPQPPSGLLWVAVPDVVRCRCGAMKPCVGKNRGPGCEPLGDAQATREQFREWHMWLCHLPLAFVLQDGCEAPGMVPWDAPSLAGVFVGGSTAWKLSSAAADLVREARRRGLHAHIGRCSTGRLIRYAASIGCTSFDSSRYSMWRDLLLQDGLTRASQPPQQRLVA